MKNFEILDCTLRDGGYYTNWDFSTNLVDTYLESFNSLPVDYLEIGYRSNSMKEYLGEYFYCPVYVLERIALKSTKKLVIILNEKDVRPEHIKNLLEPCKEIITMVRIALDPQHLKRAILLAEAIKKLGFEVGFNVMYMSKWKQHQSFLDELNSVNGVADFFYMVDSYGGVYPKDIIESIEIVRTKISCKIGFHGHNNIEMALINSITAIENGASIVDATITGMGRGAGNLKTELLLSALNASYNVDVDFNALSNVVDSFSQLQRIYEWGTNLPYMVSGANSLPQKDVMDWVTTRFYSFNSIIRALHNQKSKIDDNHKLPVFHPMKTYKNAIIIGGGPNARLHAIAIKEFIRNLEDICIIHASSKNAAIYEDLEIDQFFCLVGSEGYRLEKVFKDFKDFKSQCILPPYPRKMGTYIPKDVLNKSFELTAITITNKLKDSHTVLAFQTAFELGVENVFLAGYDGYTGNNITEMEQSLFNENEKLFNEFQDQFKIISLVPTKYNLTIQSVYSITAHNGQV